MTMKTEWLVVTFRWQQAQLFAVKGGHSLTSLAVVLNLQRNMYAKIQDIRQSSTKVVVNEKGFELHIARELQYIQLA